MLSYCRVTLDRGSYAINDVERVHCSRGHLNVADGRWMTLNCKQLKFAEERLVMFVLAILIDLPGTLRLTILKIV